MISQQDRETISMVREAIDARRMRLAYQPVVLSADPLTDIRHTRSIEAVWQAGRKVAGPVADYRADAR